jgi:CBS domain-containing protein
MNRDSGFTSLSSKTIQEFISKPVSVSAEDPVSKIIGSFVSKQIQEIFVKDEGEVGLVTLRNILRARGLSERKLATLAVRPPSMKSDDTVAQAAKAMSDMRVRTLPVLDAKGRLTGSVSTLKILQELGKLESSQTKISDIMTPRAITIDAKTSLNKARSLMVKNDIDHLPVTEDGVIIGMVTSLDLVRVLGPSERGNRLSKTSEPSSKEEVEVGGILTGKPITCNPGYDSIPVLKKMLAAEKTSAVVVADGVLGIVTLRDYIKALYPSTGPSSQPTYVVDLPEEDPESKVAEERFRRAVEALQRLYPGMLEARATVKTKVTQGRKTERKLFQVHVLIQLPRERIDFSEEGWSLADVFEGIALKLKRLRTKPDNKESYRRQAGKAESAESAEAMS